MTDWRARWAAVVASDVSARDGLGWEFTSHTGEPVWAVFREDGGQFPVFSAARGYLTPSRDDLLAMTREAVADLLAAAGLADENGWMTENVSAALLLASMAFVRWEGEEWAVESGPDDTALAWAGPQRRANAVCLAARAIGVDSEAVVGIYQDDAIFGLCFVPAAEYGLPESDSGSLRSRRDIPLVRGRINQVEVVYNTIVEGGQGSGLVSEICCTAKMHRPCSLPRRLTRGRSGTSSMNPSSP